MRGAGGAGGAKARLVARVSGVLPLLPLAPRVAWIADASGSRAGKQDRRAPQRGRCPHQPFPLRPSPRLPLVEPPLELRAPCTHRLESLAVRLLRALALGPAPAPCCPGGPAMPPHASRWPRQLSPPRPAHSGSHLRNPSHTAGSGRFAGSAASFHWRCRAAHRVHLAHSRATNFNFLPTQPTLASHSPHC